MENVMSERSRIMRDKMILGFVLSALIVVMGGGLLLKYWVLKPAFPSGLNTDSLKAVFLDNGQVYFGEVESLNKDFLRIENPHYLQTRTVLQEPIEEGKEPEKKQQLSLTALGDPGLQLHGPERAMYIPWESVQYIENLRDDSEVVKLIKEAQRQEEEGGDTEETNQNANTNANTNTSTNQ